MIRRLKKDVLKDLPDKLRKVIELPAEGAVNAVVNEENRVYALHEATLLKLQAAVELAKASDSKDDYKAAVEELKKGQRVAFAEMSRVRRDTAVAKCPMVIEHIRGILEEDASQKVVCFAHHHEVIHALKAAFPQAALVYGNVDIADRMPEVNRFQNDPACNVFIGGLRSASEGITLTASSHVVFAELDWTPGKMSQAEDRCHRIGQHDNVLVEHLVLEGSLDCRMVYTLVAKQDVMDRALDEQAKLDLGNEVVLPTTVDLKTPEAKREKPSTWESVAKEAETLRPEQVAAIHAGLRMLAGMDTDHAKEINGQGFNKFDGVIGHSLAEAPALTPKQAILGLKIARKYRKQLGSELVAAMTGE